MSVYILGVEGRCIMRTNVVIDEELIRRAQQLGGFSTKKSAIEAGLKLLVQLAAQRKLKTLRGRIRWEGSLDEMRED